MSKYDDRRLGRLALEVRGEPRELFVSDLRARIGDVVEDDEMNALVVECVMRLAEELLKRLAVV